MFSEDYIMRIIRQATSAIAKIIGFKNAGQYEEALREIDQTIRLISGLDPEIVSLMDDESLYILLTKNESLDIEKLGFIADLFKETGDIKELQKNAAESNANYIRALNYYLVISINSESSNQIELNKKIENLVAKVDSESFDDQLLLNLYSHFENINQFSKAEVLIIKLTMRNMNSSFMTDELKAFYNRLLAKTPQELAEGGMSIAEIKKKLDGLR